MTKQRPQFDTSLKLEVVRIIKYQRLTTITAVVGALLHYTNYGTRGEKLK